MKEDQKRRLSNYLLNASRFLWGLGPKLKKDAGQSSQNATYKWLHDKGFDFTRANYSEVTRQLLRHPGIEELVDRLIVPVTTDEYPDDTLNKLRTSWQTGKIPGYDEIVGLSVRKRGYSNEDIAFEWLPFLEISYLPKDDNRPSSKYVQRWGEFAGVWFEEIEPWIKEKKAYNQK